MFQTDTIGVAARNLGWFRISVTSTSTSRSEVGVSENLENAIKTF